MKQVNFITLQGQRFALPSDMTTKQKADFAGQCLQLRPLGVEYGAQWQDFQYLDEVTSVQVGYTAVYEPRDEAQAAAKEHKAANEKAKLEAVS